MTASCRLLRASPTLARLRAATEQRVNQRWYGTPGGLQLLTPVERLFRVIAERRRRAASAVAPPTRVPTIVVGNLVAGGAGKTPVVAAVVQRLLTLGARPGIVASGYGGQAPTWPRLVRPTSDPLLCGDEAVELAQLTGAPVVAGRDRTAAGRWLVDLLGCDVIVSDDGLQHYRLARDLEIALLDSERRLGNGRQLPVGPLREPADRLAEVDLVLVTGNDPAVTEETRQWAIDTLGVAAHCTSTALLQSDQVTPLLGGSPRSAATFAAQMNAVAENLADGVRCIALSGVAVPERFHADLRALGLDPQIKRFADHYSYANFTPDWRVTDWVLTTGKDAVKLSRLAQQTERGADASHRKLWERVWVMRRELRLSAAGERTLEAQLLRLLSARTV